MPELSTLEINGVPYDLRDPTKAPAGYGLGVTTYSMVAIADCNSAVNNGWYRVKKSTINTPKELEGVLRVDSYNDNYVVQKLYVPAWSSRYSVLLQRFHRADGWEEWEYINPPMQLGVEYRTTERHEGLAVCTMRIGFGNLPNASASSVEVSQNVGQLVGISGVVWSGGNRYDLATREGVVKLQVINKAIWITTNKDLSGDTATITVKYYK